MKFEICTEMHLLFVSEVMLFVGQRELSQLVEGKVGG